MLGIDGLLHKDRAGSAKVIRQILGDTLEYTVSKVVPGIAGLVMVVLFVRLIGAEQYGRFTLNFCIVSTVGTLAVGWLNQAQLRHYTQYDRNLTQFRTAVRTGAGLAIIFFLLIITISVILVELLRISTLDWTLMLYSLLGTVLIIHSTRVTTFQSQMCPHLVSKLELIRAALSIFLPLVMIRIIGANHLAILAGISAAYGIAVLWSNTWLEPGNEKLPTERRPVETVGHLLRSLWAYGWPLSLWLGCMSMFQVADRYLVRHFYGYAYTGAYASLYDLVVRSYSFLFFPITLAAHPRIMAAWNAKEWETSLSILRWAMLAQSALFVPLVVSCALLGPIIVGLLLPDASPNMVPLIVPLAAGGFIWQMSLLVHKPLEMAGNTRSMLLAVVVSLFIDILTNYWGLPYYGIIVAAYSNVIAGLVYILICFLLRPKRLLGGYPDELNQQVG